MSEFEKYLRYARQLSETTIRNYLFLIGRFREFLSQNIFLGGKLNSITRQNISDFLETLQKKNSVSSISLYIIALRCYYDWAYYVSKDRRLGEVSFFLKNIIRTKRIRKIAIIPTREEVAKLRSVLSQFLQLNSWNKNGRQYRDTLRAYVIIELLITAGLRSKELRDLQCQDINLEERTIFIKNGKGGHQRLSLFGENAVKILKEYFEINKFLPQENIFSMAQYNVVYRTVKLWAAKAGINPRIHTHSFRHYHVTESENQGVDLEGRAAQAGHLDLNTTRHYTHLNIERLKKKYRSVKI